MYLQRRIILCPVVGKTSDISSVDGHKTTSEEKKC